MKRLRGAYFKENVEILKTLQNKERMNEWLKKKKNKLSSIVTVLDLKIKINLPPHWLSLNLNGLRLNNTTTIVVFLFPLTLYSTSQILHFLICLILN